MDDPLLDKMQALMGKYHTPSPAHPAEDELIADIDDNVGYPVLTDIVKLGDAVFHDPQPAAKPQAATSTINANTANLIAQQILNEVDEQLRNQVTSLIAPQLQQAMDETLAVLLPQLTVHIEHIVHETLVQEFARHGIPLNKGDDSV
jgi:hypothetical protein